MITRANVNINEYLLLRHTNNKAFYRVLMVIDGKNNFITARGYPQLLSIRPTVRNSVLTLQHNDMEILNVDLSEV